MNNDYLQRISIKEWAEADRPREKLLLKGRSVLSDAELIAILIGSGNKELSAVELSKLILEKAANNLNELGKLSVAELTKFKGIGEAKAISIVAALELGRRRKETEAIKKEKIITSRNAYDFFKPILMDIPYEEFWILLLNRGNVVIKPERISHGGVSGTVADIKIIFLKAIECLATSIVLCHNHPSNDPKPSEQDITLTKKLKEAGKIINIPIIDHIIFAEQGYYSFADEGMM